MSMFTQGKFTVAMISAEQVVRRVLLEAKRTSDYTFAAQLLPEMLSAAQDVQGRRRACSWSFGSGGEDDPNRR